MTYSKTSKRARDEVLKIQQHQERRGEALVIREEEKKKLRHTLRDRQTDRQREGEREREGERVSEGE